MLSKVQISYFMESYPCIFMSQQKQPLFKDLVILFWHSNILKKKNQTNLYWSCKCRKCQHSVVISSSKNQMPSAKLDGSFFGIRTRVLITVRAIYKMESSCGQMLLTTELGALWILNIEHRIQCLHGLDLDPPKKPLQKYIKESILQVSSEVCMELK